MFNFDYEAKYLENPKKSAVSNEFENDGESRCYSEARL
jgi:hypothetical protein